ncbi:hypothetical protein JOM56_009372 [Amanita muscaria]
MSTSQALNATSKRPRKASSRQQAINNENLSNELAKLARAQKDIARKKQLLLKNSEPCDSDEGDEPESQDEHDEGYGKVAGGGFTSVISSQGVVHTLGGTKGLKKRHLLRADDTMSDPSEMHRPLSDLGSNGPRQTRSSPPRITQPEHVDNLLNFDDDQIDDVPPLPCAQPTRPRDGERSNQQTQQRGRSPDGSESQSRQTPSHQRGRSTFRHSESGSHVQQTRRRERSTPRSQQTHSSERTHSETPDDQGPPAKRVKLTPASFRNGRVPGKSPKASDYEEGVEKMLLNAMHEFACLIFTVNAFPDDEIQIQWARTVWKNACDKADSHYELSHRMIKLITERDSWARGLLKDAARDHFKDYYKFKKGTAHETKQYNIELRATLLTDDAFHHKDPEAGTGFAENSIVADILETALFEDSSDYGVRFAKYFNPIPINLLALVFTIIEFLIDEYTTGEKVKTSFREKNNIEQFEKHSQRIEEWNKLNKQVTTNIRMKLFKKLMKRAGASHGPSPVVAGMTMSMREKAQQALDGRTGETDSEAE